MTYYPVQLSAIPQFLDALCAYIGVLLLFTSIVLVPVLGAIFLLRFLLRNRAASLKVLVWMLLPVALCAGKLRAYYEVLPLMQVFLRVQQTVFLYRWLRVFLCVGAMGSLLYLTVRYVRFRRAVRAFSVRVIAGERVRIASGRVPPFACGLHHPKIVLPEDAEVQYSAEQLKMIVTHERMHIRLRHLWFLFGFDVLCAVFFFHPLLRVAKRAFAQDLEEAADAACMQALSVDKDAYGTLLLQVAALRRNTRELPLGASIAGHTSFQGLKARIVRIATFQAVPKRVVAAVTAGVLLLCSGMGVCFHRLSLPAYTIDGSVSVLDEAFETLYLEETEELKQAFSYDAETVTLDCAAFRALLRKNGWETQTFWLYFDGYYKLPGIGGGGQVVWVDLGDEDGVLRMEYESTTDVLNEVFKRL